MKSFKEIRNTLSEEYYSGPTAYAGNDRTNVGDITGTDLGVTGTFDNFGDAISFAGERQPGTVQPVGTRVS